MKPPRSGYNSDFVGLRSDDAMPDPKIKPPRPTPKAGPPRVLRPSGTRFADLQPQVRLAGAGGDGSVGANPTPTRLKVVAVAPGSAKTSELALFSGRRPVRDDPFLGATIDGRYRVEALLGKGGMGVVYQCSHTIIGKKVAMKVLRADLAREPEVTERFLNEAKAASAIGNPHIIDISDFGQFPDGATYFIMEYLVGTPLSKAIEAKEPLPLARILLIACQLAEGLAAAHAAGIVHRDLKPDNIYLIDHGGQKDFVKILDFGIAKVSTADTDKLTRAGAVFGTPHYMSPEQAAGSPVDHRGDIYSLGVILYELVSGRIPFDADNFMSVLSQHMYKTPAPLRSSGPVSSEILPGMEALVLKCLSKRPEDRYQNMQELLLDLERLRVGQEPGAMSEMTERPSAFKLPAYFDKPETSSQASKLPLRVGPRRHWPIVAGLTGGLAALGVIVAIVAQSSRSDAGLRAQKPQASAAVPEDFKPEPSLSRQVIVAVEPLDAHVYRGPVDLGPSPVMLGLREGQEAVLVARREGYKDSTITVDGTIARTAIKLEPLDARSAPARTKRSRETQAEKSKKKRPRSGGGEIVNPWK